MSIINSILAGAGGGFEYEKGSFTPTSNAQSRSISFSKTYTKPPFAIICVDAQNSSISAQNSGVSLWEFVDAEQLLGTKFYWYSSSFKGMLQYLYNNGSVQAQAYQGLTYGSTDTSQSGTNATRRYAREGAATLQVFNGNFLANRKYVWVAIWLPESWTQPT